MAVSVDLPVVGGDSGVWGDKINAALTILVDAINSGMGGGGGTGSAAALTPDETVHAASFTAVANTMHSVDISANNVTATLPSNPADKTQVYISVTAFTPGFILTVAHGTGDTFFSGSASLTRSVGIGQFVWLQFDSSSRKWRDIAAGMPLALSDARYVQLAALATVALSGLTSDLTGTLTLAQAAPGAVFGVSWNGTAWTYNGSTITARPSSRGDLIMLAVGNTVAPSFLLTNDVWLQDTS